MIHWKEAFDIVLAHRTALGTTRVPLHLATGRYLAEPVNADRDLPPYDRATMDGIAITYGSFEQGQREFPLTGMAPAGMPQQNLANPETCLEIATGAVLPLGADTVIPYEHLEAISGGFRVVEGAKPGQNLHRAGSDALKGQKILPAGMCIGPGVVGVLASVGIGNPLVCALPRLTLVSSGDELVSIDTKPDVHQIRKSNVHTLRACLAEFGIEPVMLHVPDHPGQLREQLANALAKSNVLVLSGGVSLGKFDLIPETLESLGVGKLFHRVAQRPGKPFWFGREPKSGCVVFSFPGNPVSTFLNYHLYFRSWLRACWGVESPGESVILAGSMRNTSNLCHFRPVALSNDDGIAKATAVPMNSSGDFLSLAATDGFVRLEPSDKEYKAGTVVPLVPVAMKY